MGKRDLYSEIKVLKGWAPIDNSNNTALVSEIIDRSMMASCVFVVETGILADADATFDVLLEDGDVSTLSDNAEVASSLRRGLSDFTFAADGKVYRISYDGNKRYVRLTLTPSNNTGSCPTSCCVILVPKVQPQAQV